MSGTNWNIERKEIIKSLPFDEKQIDFNFFYLFDKGLAKMFKYTSKNWETATITSKGIDVIEHKQKFVEELPFIQVAIQEINAPIFGSAIQAVNSQGNLQWNRTYGSETYDYFYSVMQTPDGGYLAAKSVQNSVGDWFFSAEIIKLYASGEVEFTINYPSTTDMMRMDARFILDAGDGGYVFTGHQTTSDDPHISREHVWLAKIGATEIPEFQSRIILPLSLMATLAVIICKKRTRSISTQKVEK